MQLLTYSLATLCGSFSILFLYLYTLVASSSKTLALHTRSISTKSSPPLSSSSSSLASLKQHDVSFYRNMLGARFETDANSCINCMVFSSFSSFFSVCSCFTDYWGAWSYALIRVCLASHCEFWNFWKMGLTF